MINITNILNKIYRLSESVKSKTIAFVPGSFKPPHRQHLDTVKEYSKIADKVIVLISAPTKKPRLTNLNTIITPEDAKQIFEIYIKDEHLSNVQIDISEKPSPITAVIDYINDHKSTTLKNTNIILGASTKDDDWKRWTGSFFDKFKTELLQYNITIIDPQKTAITHSDSNIGATDMRNHIDDFEYLQDFFPTSTTLPHRKLIFSILNKSADTRLNEGGNMFNNTTRINQENVSATLDAIKSTLLPKLKLDQNSIKILGSTGKKLPGGTSGDIDIGIDLNALKSYNISTYKDFVKYATSIFNNLPYEFKAVSKYNIFSFSWPIENVDGKQPNSFVQVDLMPVNDLEMTDWGYYSTEEKHEKWKSAVRNQLLMKYASYFDMKIYQYANIDGEKRPVDYERYSIDRTTGLWKKHLSRIKPDGTFLRIPKVLSKQLITNNPRKIIKILFGPNANFNNFFTTQDTWNEIKKSKLFKNSKIRSAILRGVIAELDRAHISYPHEFTTYISESTLHEGGRLFGDKVGPINQENVQATLNTIEDKLLKHLNLNKEHYAILGSTGKKLPGGTSGDIDIGIDLKYMAQNSNIGTYDDFRHKVNQLLDLNKIDHRDITSRKMISLVWPIENVDGKQPNSFVQVDLMPVDNLEMVKWGSYGPSEKESPYKGMVRNELLRQYTDVLEYKVIKQEKINGQNEIIEYSKLSLDIRYGLFRKHLSRQSKTPDKLLRVPKVISNKLITDNAESIVKYLFGSNVELSQFLTIDSTWKVFVNSKIYKNIELRNIILSKSINEYNRNNVKYPKYMYNALTDKSLLRQTEIVSEGGNALTNVTRINQTNSQATVDKLLSILPKLLNINISGIAVLGSITKKAPTESSGDIDIGIDMKKTHLQDIHTFLDYAQKQLISHYPNIECNMLYGLNTLSFSWPIENVDGKQPNSFVQVDLMPAFNFELLKFGQYSPSYLESKYKGVVRNLLLTDIAGRKHFIVKKTAIINNKEIPVIIEKYALTTNDGLYIKTFTKEGKNGQILKTPKVLDRKLITNDVQKILRIILNPTTQIKDCLTVDGVWNEYKKTPEYNDIEKRTATLLKTTKELQRRGIEYPTYLNP